MTISPEELARRDRRRQILAQVKESLPFTHAERVELLDALFQQHGRLPEDIARYEATVRRESVDEQSHLSRLRFIYLQALVRDMAKLFDAEAMVHLTQKDLPRNFGLWHDGTRTLNSIQLMLRYGKL